MLCDINWGFFSFLYSYNLEFSWCPKFPIFLLLYFSYPLLSLSRSSIFESQYAIFFLTHSISKAVLWVFSWVIGFFSTIFISAWLLFNVSISFLGAVLKLQIVFINSISSMFVLYWASIRCLFSYCVFFFSKFSRMLSIYSLMLYIVFIISKHVLSIPHIFLTFSMKACWTLSNTFHQPCRW